MSKSQIFLHDPSFYSPVYDDFPPPMLWIAMILKELRETRILQSYQATRHKAKDSLTS